MPRDKDLKRVIRKRMEKTGESYTTARAHTLRTTETKVASAPPPPDYAQRAGMSDDTIAAKTGRDWAGWVAALDAEGAAGMKHTALAKLVHEKFGVQPWWTQAVAVGYERIKGLREIGQRRDGGYDVNRSRTYNVPVSALFDAWADDAKRTRWLAGADHNVRTATPPRLMRIGWNDGTTVTLYFAEKAASKSTVTIQHFKLPDRATADRMKVFWSERLAALGDILIG